MSTLFRSFANGAELMYFAILLSSPQTFAFGLDLVIVKLLLYLEFRNLNPVKGESSSFKNAGPVLI